MPLDSTVKGCEIEPGLKPQKSGILVRLPEECAVPMGPDMSQTQTEDSSIIIASESMARLMSMLKRVASSAGAVLITGETGAGKEVIARAVHQNSLRCGRPWVDVNCAALPEHLIESELFGYERGAFSGAETTKPGLFEIADGGTLFLDEIGELDSKLQVKLLRVLDGVPYYRLGGSRKVSVDVRIIAATNQPLEELVRTGDFRRDLFHRLSQFHLRVPALRDRKEDITALAEYFLRMIDPTRTISARGLERLHAYSWPGNVRELKSVIVQAATLSSSREILADELPVPIDFVAPRPAAAVEAEAAPKFTDLDSLERQTILDALQRNRGHQGLTSEQLGISRRTLSRKLKAYNLGPSRIADPAPLGKLGPEEQSRFRCTLEVPVLLTLQDGSEVGVTAQNVGINGVCLTNCPMSVRNSRVLDLYFQLPETDDPFRAKGRIVWAQPAGTLGVCFESAPRSCQLALAQWLKRKQLEEGWTD